MVRPQRKFDAFATENFLSLRCASQIEGERILRQLEQVVKGFEKKFSRFRPDSELTRVNKSAGESIEIDHEFADILRKAREMSIATNGIFNPFILPNLQSIGYRSSWPDPGKNSGQVNFDDRKIFEITNLEIGDDWVRIPANSAIDLGGIGKGYLLNKLSNIAEESGINDYWFSLGGDLIVSGDDNNRSGWSIEIVSATCDETIKIIESSGNKISIAASGTVKRKGEGWHHLIDPKSGKSASTDILCATVVAKSGIESDIYAKCLVILDHENAPAFFRKSDTISAYLQIKDSNKLIELQNG